MIEARRRRFFGSEVTHDLEAFKSCSDLIVVNRRSDELADVAGRVYTRGLFRREWDYRYSVAAMTFVAYALSAQRRETFSSIASLILSFAPFA